MITYHINIHAYALLGNLDYLELYSSKEQLFFLLPGAIH